MDRPVVAGAVSSRKKKLVIGASGFLGSHVTRALVASGADVRVMLRRTSSTKGIDDLDVERCYGDVFDDDALRAAMGMRMAELMSPLDHGKAERELGWEPDPVEHSIRKAAVFFASRP